MKNILFAGLLTGIIYILGSCNQCRNAGGYYPDASQLKKYSFKPGTYWVYQDSISGIIDSQIVYFYAPRSNVIIGYQYGANEVQDCPVSTDAFSMSVASFWNGVLHDTLFFSNNNNNSEPNSVQILQSMPPFGYEYNVMGFQTDTLTNFTVSGLTYPRVYLSINYSGNYLPLIYNVDNVGIIKAVFNDTINGQRTWNLLRYHVINP